MNDEKHEAEQQGANKWTWINIYEKANSAEVDFYYKIVNEARKHDMISHRKTRLSPLQKLNNFFLPYKTSRFHHPYKMSLSLAHKTRSNSLTQASIYIIHIISLWEWEWEWSF